MTQQYNVALVTGASRGIGAAIAQRLAGDGFAVVLNYAGPADEADQLVRTIEAAGGRAISVRADVSDPVAVERLCAAAQTAFGGVDVLVDNAGIMQLATLADKDAGLRLHASLNGRRHSQIAYQCDSAPPRTCACQMARL